MKKVIFFLVGFPLILSCRGQVRSLDKAALQLEDFDLSTHIRTLLPDRTKSKDYGGYYEVKSTLLEKDTVYDDEFGENKTAQWIEYRQRQSSSRDVLAVFGNQDFNTMNFATTLDGRIMVINAVAREVGQDEAQAFVASLNKKYGKAAKTQGEFFKPFDIYTWQTEDRILKYCMVYDDEKGTLKIVMDKENNTMEAGDKHPHYTAYFYLVGKTFADKVIGNMHTGDLIYCD